MGELQLTFSDLENQKYSDFVEKFTPKENQ